MVAALFQSWQLGALGSFTGTCRWYDEAVLTDVLGFSLEHVLFVAEPDVSFSVIN